MTELTNDLSLKRNWGTPNGKRYTDLVTALCSSSRRPFVCSSDRCAER
jgi:hypothetical protein